MPNNGDVTVAVASEKALELFTPIGERDYRTTSLHGFSGSVALRCQ